VSLPSDRLRGLYEARAEQQYAAAAGLPDPRIDRKFGRICELVRGQLPCNAFLDAGCGDGRYLAALAADLPSRVAGVDIAERILETARARAPHADLRQANLESLPFGDGEFDVVLSSQVIEHVVDERRAAAELARVLRPGGALVLSTDNARNLVTRALNVPRSSLVAALRLRGRRGRIESPATAYTRESLRSLLEAAGLRVDHLETFRFHLMWPLDLAPATRFLNVVDERLPSHGVGDILAAIARKP
jgi:2-polyprenyl-3-methyl-5-hydroxy-6-metoxy-1,4-benzoquinol methylase